MMPELADIAAAALFSALVLYVLTGGADFGGGVWSLVARLRGETKTATLAERAIAPIWEVNHIWMIVVVVLLFVCFAPVYAFLSTVLHIPLTFILIGLILRGTAYAFSGYGLGSRDETAIWQRLFGIASLITPFALGQVVGAIAVGELVAPDAGRSFLEVYIQPWLDVFPVICGVFTVLLFAYLAAVYLTVAADTESGREMYRMYAMGSGVGLGCMALMTWVAIPDTYGGQLLQRGLFARGWSLPLHLATGGLAVVTLVLLYRRRFRTAQACAIGQAVCILLGWAAAQYPYLVPGHYTVAQAAAEAAVTGPILIALSGGGLLLFPALYYLFRIFKTP